ncbi:unnamed protein product [Rotaria sp. Silwood2]|nr:unnamed protein product [Rotaria sp. Silwood2]CAF2768623.1 unnamed protein product [Rotaria sp. Silwood2]CAF3042671.1 unnamed protein product [Rotaria sp. Silwood2]CAF3166886.1 unnamed protein product [Rotaria sp. Silwood2]CAF4006036.1 unnamed protein product [Rotaria sp. Silwood2]
MGNGGMSPGYHNSSHPYPHGNMVPNRPYYNHSIYTPVGYRPSYGYPTNTGIGYGRGFQQPYSPMINGFHQGAFNNQIVGRGFYNSPYPTSGGLQSAPPSARPNGHIHLHRPGEHRPHFDEQ